MFADAHCDTITRILDNNESLFENSGHVDLKRLINVGCKMQFFAIFIEPKYEDKPYLRFLSAYEKFISELDKNKDIIKLVKSKNDIDGEKVSALLTVEGGSVIGKSLGTLKDLYDLGVRLLTLTWNGDNEIASGVYTNNDTGLTDFGKKVVKEMNKLGMIIDVSHLSDKGFCDVMELSKAPVFASHSNCRVLCYNKRNLTDLQIKSIIESNGYIGLNFYGKFLGENPDVTDIIRHAEHILALGGQDVLGFGGDFDGVDSLPKGIDGVQNMTGIINEFCKLGYSQKLLNKLFYENLCNKVKQILKN